MNSREEKWENPFNEEKGVPGSHKIPFGLYLLGKQGSYTKEELWTEAFRFSDLLDLHSESAYRSLKKLDCITTKSSSLSRSLYTIEINDLKEFEEKVSPRASCLVFDGILASKNLEGGTFREGIKVPDKIGGYKVFPGPLGYYKNDNYFEWLEESSTGNLKEVTLDLIDYVQNSENPERLEVACESAFDLGSYISEGTFTDSRFLQFNAGEFRDKQVRKVTEIFQSEEGKGLIEGFLDIPGLEVKDVELSYLKENHDEYLNSLVR